MLAGFFSIYDRSWDRCGIYKISTKGGWSLTSWKQPFTICKRCCEILLEPFLICVIWFAVEISMPWFKLHQTLHRVLILRIYLDSQTSLLLCQIQPCRLNLHQRSEKLETRRSNALLCRCLLLQVPKAPRVIHKSTRLSKRNAKNLLNWLSIFQSLYIFYLLIPSQFRIKPNCGSHFHYQSKWGCAHTPLKPLKAI